LLKLFVEKQIKDTTLKQLNVLEKETEKLIDLQPKEEVIIKPIEKEIEPESISEEEIIKESEKPEQNLEKTRILNQPLIINQTIQEPDIIPLPLVKTTF
jgi:hypothetical protein